MAYAFNTLRPLFRERGKINAEVTGRLTEALGGIRVVKSYTAEKREEIVFAKGAHRLFRNIAKSMTGVSATTAGSTVVVGVVGVLMIWLGGRAILAGEMTLGDLVMYIFFIGLVAAPLVSIASIGTQITEAFAGLDRIREMLDMATEDDEDAQRAPRRAGCAATSRSSTCGSSTTPGQPVLRGVSFQAPRRHHHGARRLERLGQEHADQPGDGVQPARRRAACSSTAATWRTCGCGDYREQLGVGAAGELPLRRHDRRERRLRAARRHARRDRRGVPRRALRRVHLAVPAGLRHRRRRARHQAVGRTAAARVDRARDPREPAHPHPRRGHVEPRQRERADDPGRPAPAALRPHHVRHRAPAVHDPQRRPDPGARGRRDRRARHARRAAGGQRPLPAALRQAVQVRGRSVHQPGRGLHAGARTVRRRRAARRGARCRWTKPCCSKAC